MKPLQRSYKAPEFVLEHACENKQICKFPEKFKSYHKILTIIILFGLYIAYRLVNSQPSHKNCVVDNTHEWTFVLNRWISENAARPFIGLGQLIMDISITSMLIYWQFFDQKKDAFRKKFQGVVSGGVFSIWEAVYVVTMPFESYTVWFNPGFPTWTVEYGHTSDYFFSGHTGTIVLLYLEARRLNLPKVVQYSLFVSIFYIIGMLLIARVHYTTDVFAGLFFAGFCFETTDYYLQFLDMIINSPYRVFEIIKQKVKRKLQENENEGTSMFDIQHD